MVRGQLRVLLGIAVLLCATLGLWTMQGVVQRTQHDNCETKVAQLAKQVETLSHLIEAQTRDIRALKSTGVAKEGSSLADPSLQGGSEDEDNASLGEDDKLVPYNVSGAYKPPNEWLSKLDTRGDPSVSFRLPLPPGDIRRYIGRGGGILSRGQEFLRVQQKESRTATESQCEALKRFLTVPTYNCRNAKRFGNAGDGGWTVCLDRPLPTPASDCVSYSFGLAFDWSYDRDISKSCKDYAFDPTLRIKGSQNMRNDEKHVEGYDIDYYSMGLSGHGSPIINSRKRIPTMTLQAVMKMLGHSHVDILKVDVEGSEWGMIHSMADWKDSPLDRTDQLLLEMHFTHLGFFYLWDALMVLDKKGFKLFFIHQNLQCKHLVLGNSACSIRSCMEFGFIRPPAS